MRHDPSKRNSGHLVTRSETVPRPQCMSIQLGAIVVAPRCPHLVQRRSPFFWRYWADACEKESLRKKAPPTHLLIAALAGPWLFASVSGERKRSQLSKPADTLQVPPRLSRLVIVPDRSQESPGPRKRALLRMMIPRDFRPGYAFAGEQEEGSLTLHYRT